MESASPRLDGWKAIAAYLGRDERTAQRWRQRGLPVHLVPGGKRGTVFAYTHEIDHWLTEEAAKERPPASPHEHGRSASEEGLQAAAPAEESSTTTTTRSKLRPTAVFGAAVLVVTVLAVFSGRMLSLWQTAPRPVVRAEVTRNGLVAWTAEGDVAFTIPARDLIPPHMGSSTLPEVFAAQDPIVIDMDRDDEDEVVAILGFRKDRLVASHEVVSYSNTGVLKWRYRMERNLRFGDRDFDGPWRVADSLVTREADGGLRLVLAFIHDVWWPSFIVSLNATGKEQLHYVHSGHLYKLQHLKTPDGDLLLASGVSNELKGAVLTAFDPGAPPAVSPQDDPAFACQECPGEPSAAYILFPPAELAGVQGRPYNLGDKLSVTQSEVQLSVHEFDDPTARSHYRLSHALDVQSFGMSDVYWEKHRQFERTGEVGHRAEECPEREGRQVRVWTTEGWRQVWVPSERPPG